MAKNVRDLKAQVQTLVSALGQQVAKSTPSTPATPPADAGTAKVEELLAELSFRDALADAGVQVDSARRQKLKTLWHAEGRPDLSEWLPSTVTTFGWTGKPAVAPVAPAAPPAPNASNAGAPVAPQGNAPLDPNPLRWPPSVVDAMSPQKFREALQEYDAKAGKGNPFAAMRRR
ncbi:MAG TPA: hypothetical protein VEJ18_20295 [Planctomycetota bacterium]|nr:hypothetical protein [Planctomycetota bacterium]